MIVAGETDLHGCKTQVADSVQLKEPGNGDSTKLQFSGDVMGENGSIAEQDRHTFSLAKENHVKGTGSVWALSSWWFTKTAVTFVSDSELNLQLSEYNEWKKFWMAGKKDYDKNEIMTHFWRADVGDKCLTIHF